MNPLRRLFALFLLAALLAVAGCQKYAAAEVRRGLDLPASLFTPKTGAPPMDVTDFDFLAGTWDVANRRLRTRHEGCTDWDEFPGRSTMRPHLGGLANVDEIAFPTKGWSGMTVRLFDLEARQWGIWWVNSRDGKLQAPVFGGFRGDVGEFLGEDLDEGRPVQVRYRWTRQGPDAARWEQAFSTDAGLTWETNWVMDLKRSG